MKRNALEPELSTRHFLALRQRQRNKVLELQRQKNPKNVKGFMNKWSRNEYRHNAIIQCCGSASIIMQIRVPTFLHVDPDPGGGRGQKYIFF